MNPRQQMRMRLFPYTTALGLLVSWILLLFLGRGTITILEGVRVPLSSIQIRIFILMGSWEGWTVPYIAAAIAVVIRWYSEAGWLWALTLCLSSDFVGLVLLNMQIPVVTLIAPSHLKLFHTMVGLGVGVLILLQVITVSLVFNRRLFVARSNSHPAPLL